MASRSERKQRKQEKRGVDLLDRAIRRNDALTLLELVSKGALPTDARAVAQAFVSDMSDAERRKDGPRLVRLTRAFTPELVHLDLLEPNTAMGCRWTMFRVSLQQADLVRSRSLWSVLSSDVEKRAPALARWIHVALANEGRVSLHAAGDLPRLLGDAETSNWSFPESTSSIDQLFEAVLAGSVLFHPSVLATHVTRHFARLEASDRRALAQRLLPAIRWRAIEIARSGPKDALRAALGLLGRLEAEHPDPDSMAFALRLARRELDPHTSAEDFRCTAWLIEAAFRHDVLRPLTEAAFDALPPNPNTLEVGRRLAGAKPSAAIWAASVAIWEDGDRPEPPSWLVDAHRALMQSGELERWLVAEEGRTKLLSQTANALPWHDQLELIERIWDRVPVFEHRLLASLASDGLAAYEPPERGTTRGPASHMTIRQMLECVDDILEQPSAPERLYQFGNMLAGLPPNMEAPPEVAHVFESLIAHQQGTLGSKQRAFVRRSGARILPYSIQILHRILLDRELANEGVQWIDAHLGTSPTPSTLVTAADMLWTYEWPELHAHIEQRLIGRASANDTALIRIFLALVALAKPRDTCIQRIAGLVLDALDDGRIASIEGSEQAIRHARRVLRGQGRRKKAKPKPPPKPTTAPDGGTAHAKRSTARKASPKPSATTTPPDAATPSTVDETPTRPRGRRRSPSSTTTDTRRPSATMSDESPPFSDPTGAQFELPFPTGCK